MAAVQQLVAELAITISNATVWSAIGLALLFGAICLVVGVTVCRLVGLLHRASPAGETLGVGLSAGLMILAAGWAAIWSGGRSSFTPVAVGFGVAIAAALVTRIRGSRPRPDRAGKEAPPPEVVQGTADRKRDGRHRAVVGLAAGAFVVAVALLYGATVAPSPREGLQPVEFNDVAFYAVLGRDLAATGTETTMSASGFDAVAGLPAQSWYHWGELWLASAAIKAFDVTAMAARYFIVLPLVLLAAGAASGTVVRRMTRSTSTSVFLFGFAACLLLAPLALLPGPVFASWASGMLFGVTLYGAVVVAVLLVLYAIATVLDRDATWALAAFVGAVVAFVLPAHLAVALLGLVGLGTVAVVRVGRWLLDGRHRRILSSSWVRIWLVAAVVGCSSVVWGMATGHGWGGGGGQALVAPFNSSWQGSVGISTLSAGVFVAIVLAIPLVWRRDATLAEVFLGTVSLLFVGAVGWGARIGDFTMFYLFFAGIAVVATPVATVAVRTLWTYLEATHHHRLAIALILFCFLQLEAGVPNSIRRLQAFGPYAHESISTSMLDAISSLPTGARIAYACEPFEETGFGVPRFGSIDAHTGRRVVPLCFNAEVLSFLNGAPLSPDVPNLYFANAPQRALYPDAASAPTASSIAEFLAGHGIRYVLVDERHTDAMVTGAIPIASSGEMQLLQLP